MAVDAVVVEVGIVVVECMVLDDLAMEKILGDLLKEKGKTLGLAESCTGGFIGHHITQVNGSSADLAGGIDLITFLAENGVFSSRGEAKKMLQNGGLSLNKEKITALDFKITESHLLNGKYLLLQKGKKDYTLAVFQ